MPLARAVPSAAQPGKTAGDRRSRNREGLPIQKGQQQAKVRVNRMIRARQVRVIDEEGNQLGIMSPADALREAEDRGLDLVEVAEQANPPVCRIMDYGKYRYQQSKRAKESKKHQHTITVKEIKYRPKIDPHDFDFKTNHVREFLEAGNKVKITIMFRGRELAHPEFGKEIIARVVEAVEDLGQSEIDPQRLRLEGRNMSVMLAPLKTGGSKGDKSAKGDKSNKPAKPAKDAAPKQGSDAKAEPAEPPPTS